MLINTASICTIDSFCFNILKNNFFRLGLEPDFKIADASELELIKNDVLGKIFEEYYKENEPKGEFVLVIEGAAEEKEEVSDETLEKEFFELVEGGMTRTFAAKTLARKYNLSKREIYERFKEEN